MGKSNVVCEGKSSYNKESTFEIMDTRKKIIIGVGGLVALAVFILFLNKLGIFSKSPGQTPSVVTSTPPEVITREPAPKDIVVPDAKTPSSSIASNTARPNYVVSAAPRSAIGSRGFEIQVEGDRFSPDTVIVTKGDVISLGITAIDKEYDFTQPDYSLIGVPLKMGIRKPIGFQATATGKFKFYCSVCGGPEKGPVGYLIVTAKK